MTAARERTQNGIGLRWFDSLQIKLSLLFLVLLALLGGATFVASQRLIGDGLDSASFRYESEVSRRLSAQIDGITSTAKTLADLLVLVARDGRISRPIQKETIEGAAVKLGSDSAIVSFGIWPEPVSNAASTVRDSQAWVRDEAGKWVQRADYNDRDTIPYWREAWYTPARLVTGDACYWTPRYRDPLTRRDVVSCVRPLLGMRGFEGAVTVTMDLDALSTRFAALTAGDSGYALLIDRNGQMLALSALAKAKLGETVATGRNIAELGQKLPSFNPLAVAVHTRNEAFQSDALRSALYDARQISQLKDRTRDLARNDADSILAAIWNHAVGRHPAALATLLQLGDPVLGENGYAALSSLAGTDWQLVSVTATREGQDSTRHLISEVLAITLAAVAVMLLLALLVTYGTVISPLRRMLRQLDRVDDAGSAAPVVLDQSGSNEIGAIAHWFNERGAHLRELRERVHSTGGQLAMETAERQRAQSALTRAQERNHLALTTINDGVVTIDERGYIEDMNPIAERLLGVNLRAVRGTPFTQSFQARLAGDEGGALPNPVEVALERGSRIEYPDGVILCGKDVADREIYLAVAPLRTQHGRSMGCVVVLHPFITRPNNSAILTEAPDAVTGLGGRNACERRVRHLLDSARIGVRQHALLVVEVGSSNVSIERSKGDALQMRIAELLGADAGDSEQVFSLPGGRFAMTLERLDATQALEHAQGLIERIARTREQADLDEETLSATIGICVIDSALENALEGIRRAGAACDAALRLGGGTVSVFQAEHDQIGADNDDEMWIQRIRRGLDHNQFHLTTQWTAPSRAHLGEGQVFEVLVALEDEEGFWAQPASFLPTAERHLLAGEIDRWVIRRVLEALSNNGNLCERIAFCSVGLSAGSMTDPAFLDFIAEQFNDHPRVPIDKLCFELRGAMTGASAQPSQRFLEALHALGCRVAIDQHGGRQPAGSFDLQRHLPLDFVKLDARQFRNVAEDRVEQTLAENSVQLAHLLNRRVIVTQVDTDALATLWRRIGADYMQGYAIAKPSPVPFMGAA